MATGPAIDKITALDFVLFVELIGPTSPAHDQSTPLIDADLIRPGGLVRAPAIRRRLDPASASSTRGFMMGGAVTTI